MKPTVYLTDTTLRDGEQRPGLVIPLDAKLRLMHALDTAGVYQLDAGIPAAGACARDAMRRMMAERGQIRISAWNRMRLSDIRDSMEVEPDVIHISVPASDRLIYRVLGEDRTWVENTLLRCTALAREQGYEVTVGLQDASRADIPFMLRLAALMRTMEITIFKLADTIGTLTPPQVRSLIERMGEAGLPLGIHTHNDLGMAVPIALEAAQAGVSHVDVTCFGIGERAGNCDLFSFAEYGAPALSVFPVLQDPEALKRRVTDILYPAISRQINAETGKEE